MEFNNYFLFSMFKVYELVGLTELYYAGSHGMDIMFPIRETVSTDHSNCIKSTNSQVYLFYIYGVPSYMYGHGLFS